VHAPHPHPAQAQPQPVPTATQHFQPQSGHPQHPQHPQQQPHQGGVNMAQNTQNTQNPNGGQPNAGQTYTPQPPPAHDPRQGQQGQPGQQGQQANAGRRAGIMDINSMMRRPIARKSTGEVVIKYRDQLTKQMERNFKQGFENAFQLLVLDNNSSNVGPLSSILVCYHEVVANQHYLAVYTLLVEGSATALNPKVINFGGRNIEIETVAGDVFNDVLWSRIMEHCIATYGVALTCLDAGQMVLPRELDSEDEERMRRVIFNATQACFTILETIVGGKELPFTIALVNTGSENLVARLDYNPGNAESATGDPIRSDVRISLQGSISEAQAAGGFEQVRELCVVDGFVDLVYSPPGLPIPGQLPISQYYYPRFVITRADTEIDAITMELQLLALAQATLLNRNMAWAGVFRPLHHIKGMDTKDIGAIGFEVNLTDNPQSKPDRIDTKAKNFGDAELYQLVTMCIHDKLLYSMDIEEVGELSWIHQAYIASADGNRDAYQMVIDAANTLTLGHFGSIFQGGPICYNDFNRVHLGYYIDEEKVRQDVRKIDYLAMLNIAGKTDPKLIMKWGETFDNRDVPIEIRLEERANILKATLGNNLKIKGYARRITFDPNFMIALNMACGNAGLVVRPNNLIQEFTGQGVRGNLNAGLYGVSSQQVSGLFNAATSPWGVARGGISSQFQGRWGRQY
jgi:hypothetical protein